MNAIQNIFKKTTDHDERQSQEMIQGGRRKGENENPYLSARRTWNDYNGSIIASRRMWQIVGIASLMILMITVAGLISIAGQSKFIPYIVEVDKLGNVTTSGPISGNTHKTDPRILKSAISTFIMDARLVTPDVTLQRAAVLRIYSHLVPNNPATQKMHEWLNKNSPFERSTKVMVSSEIKSVMPQTIDTWQIDWTETTRDRNGGLVDKPETFRALVTVYIVEPSPDTTEEQIRMNPLGIYVNDFSWQKLL